MGNGRPVGHVACDSGDAPSRRRRGLVFFDKTNQAAYRIGADGNLLWSWGKKGEGPGELLNVRAMDVEQDGSVVLVDSGNRRVVRLSADGQPLEADRTPEQGRFVDDVAALPGRRLAVTGGGPGSVLALWDGGGVVEVALPIEFGEPNPLHHQGGLVRWDDEGWFVRVPLWQRLDDVPGHRIGGRLPFRRAFGFSEGARGASREPVAYANDKASLRERPVVVRGRGHVVRPVRRRESTARPVAGQIRRAVRGVLGNRRSPHYANEAVVSGDRVFTVGAWDVFPSIVALARRAGRRAEKPKADASWV